MSLTMIYLYQLRDYWASVVQSGTNRMNVNTDLSKLTLDIIGVAGTLPR